MRRRPKLYLDTSVISAMFDTRNPERATLTGLFWQGIGGYQAFVSDLVLLELRKTRTRRLARQMEATAAQLPSLPLTEAIEALGKEYIAQGAIPSDYPEDAYHIAVAVANEMDMLLSWNFKHIVRNRTREVVRMVNSSYGLRQIEILTPAELL